MSDQNSLGQQLPATWAVTTLGDLVDYGRTNKAEPDEIEDSAWVLELEDIEKDSSRLLQRLTFGERQSKSTKNRFDAGDVLYGKLRPYLNKVLIADQPGFCTTEIVPIKCPAHLDTRFLFHWLKHPAFLRYVEAESHGMNMPRLGTEAGKAAPFVLAPRPEQTRIADQLDTLLARIKACNDHLDVIPDLLKRFRQAVLDVAASGDLINDEGAPADLVRLGAVLAEPMRNGKSVRDGSGLQVLRLTALKHSGIDLAETKAGDWTGIRDIERFLVQNGDYLVSRGNGSKELVGRGGLVDNCRTNIAFPDTMIRIRPDTSRLLPDYLKFVWRASVVRRQIEAVAKTTAGIWKVSQPDLESILFPLPSRERQAVIVERVQALMNFASSIESHHVVSALQVQRLTPLTLAKAFRGELVPQDANDVPASALLQKLKIIHTSAVAAPSRKRTKTPEKRLNMSESDKDSVKAAILELGVDRFTFDELRAQFSGDYEHLKAGLFELLGEPNPVVRQVFDKQTNSMQLARVWP
jgi:type I restriction enzyme S subunit